MKTQILVRLCKHLQNKWQFVQFRICNSKLLITTLLITLNFLLITSTFAQQNWQEVDSLRQVYQNKQSYDTALVYANKALVLVEKQYGKNDTLYADMLYNIGDVYYSKGNYKKIIEYGLVEKQIRTKLQGKLHENTLGVSSDIALCYMLTGQYDKALPLYLETLENTEKSLGKEHSEYGIRLNNLAGLYEAMGQYDKALPLYLAALKNTKRSLGKEHALYGTYLNNLALCYKHTGQYNKALPLFLEALENCEKSYGKEYSGYGLKLANLAVLYKTMGQYNKALTLNTEALKNCEKSLGKEHSEYGIRLNNLAELYYDMGQSKKALPLLLKALENCEKSLGKEHSEYGIRLNNLAKIYQTMKQYNKALPLYLEALRNCEKSLGKEHSLYGKYLNNLAYLYYTMEQNDKALPLFLEALENTKKSLGKEHSEYGIGLNNLAKFYYYTGEHNKAIPLFLEALENCEKSLGKEHLLYGKYLNSLALLYKTEGQYKKALPLFLKGIANINNNITKNFNFLSEKGKEAYFNLNYSYFERLNSFALQSKNQFPNITTTVFDNTVRNKGILLKSSTAMRTAILSSKDTTLINKYTKWISLNKEIVNLYSKPITKRQKNPEKLEEQANILERNLVRSSQEFSDFTNILKIKWQDIQKALQPNELAIEFVHFNLYKKEKTDTTLYCALIVTPKSKQPKTIPLFREKQLEKIIGKFGGNNYSYINSIYGKNSEVNTELYNLIWAKIDNYLDSIGVSRYRETKLNIYLSPSGLLHKISFSAIAKKQNVYLCDAYNIEIKSTTGKITKSNGVSQRHTVTTATLFGGITYNTDSTKQEIWSYLEGTKTETQKIDKILKKGKINVNYYSNTLATEDKFKLMATNSNILHIATHGFFYPDPKEIQKEENSINVNEVVFRGGDRGFGVYSFVYNPNSLMRSGLVFAGANDVWSKQTENDTIDDGVLTAQEVAQIDMRKTDLVVMSACETGLGDIKGSEGVYGLQRAFKMAGVKYEIMSLWQVPDKETEEFMTTFYKKLIKNRDIKQAFAKTQKEMRKKYDPYFWAAFVLIE